MTFRRLTGPQVLARMRRGEALLRGDYTAAYFPDNARPGAGVLARLIREGLINDAAPHVGSPYSLTPLACARACTMAMRLVLTYVGAGRPRGHPGEAYGQSAGFITTYAALRRAGLVSPEGEDQLTDLGRAVLEHLPKE